jgi:hypothetical protein
MTQALEGFFNNGTLIRPTVALQQLLAHPRKFLKKYYVAVDEVIGQPGGTQQVYFYTTGGLDSFRPGSILGTKRFHVSSSYHFSPNAPPLGRTAKSYCATSVCYIPMLQATTSQPAPLTFTVATIMAMAMSQTSLEYAATASGASMPKSFR